LTMGNKAVIIVTTHTSEQRPDGMYFLEPLSKEHADEVGIPNMIEFKKNTGSFIESVSVLADKMKRIKDILDE